MMKRLLRPVGIVIYWLSWPFLVLYIRDSQRTRLLLNSGDRILVVKGLISDGRWGLPGGGLHRGEEPVIGLLRELREETGLVLEPGSIKSLGIRPYSHNGFRFQCHYFSASLPDTVAVHPRLEVIETRWLNKRELNDKNSSPDFSIIMALLAAS